MFQANVIAKQLLRTAQSGSVTKTTTTTRRLLLGARHTGASSLRRSLVTTSFRLPDPAEDPHAVELTKIVATIGPTSEQASPLQQVTAAGMKIMRLNFSHATTEEVELRCTNLTAAEVRWYRSFVRWLPKKHTQKKREGFCVC